MEKHEVVLDIISVAPKDIAKIKYVTKVEVNEGNILTPTQVKDMPTVEWNAEPKALYTLCFTDPDNLSRKEPIYREWHHWLVGNIPGNDISKGETLSEFIGSGPMEGTGIHRYVFLIYKQPENKPIAFDEKRLTNRSAEHRGMFSIANFAKKYNLGNPVAGNLYQAEYDSYVPTLYKQLGVEL